MWATVEKRLGELGQRERNRQGERIIETGVERQMQMEEERQLYREREKG